MYCGKPKLHVIPGCFCFVKYCPEIYNSSRVARLGLYFGAGAIGPSRWPINSFLAKLAGHLLGWPGWPRLPLLLGWFRQLLDLALGRGVRKWSRGRERGDRAMSPHCRGLPKALYEWGVGEPPGPSWGGDCLGHCVGLPFLCCLPVPLRTPLPTPLTPPAGSGPGSHCSDCK